MDEKVIIKSERYNVGRGLLIFFVVVAILCVSLVASDYFSQLIHYKDAWDSCNCLVWADYHKTLCPRKYYSSPEEATWEHTDLETPLYVTGGSGTLCLLLYAWLHSYEITVTDKRVYGKTAFGKRVDLPVDSVSAVGSRWPKGISVATSSGKISFLMIKNRDEIHKCVSGLLIERQGKTAATTASIQQAPQSNADELKKYKELLDNGIITQEEFDAKKKQLLGL